MKKISITNSRLAEELLHDEMANLDHEEVWLIFLTCKKTLIATEMVSRGTLTDTAIDYRTVVRRALLNNAESIVIAHNHPSGDAWPSIPDIRFTTELKYVCKIMKIELADHLIISEDEYYSFNEEKVIKHKARKRK